VAYIVHTVEVEADAPSEPDGLTGEP